MPHINRIRVNNVKYNFGTQSYDDFLLKPFCKNTLYDLANGGGKSVLMLLMLQTILPNCTLDEKQPIEKLFRTGDGSNTIHSLIEWKLDEKDQGEGFSYMTTGFCAKKAGNSVTTDALVQETASIEYFNYCIFYRDYNENDIRNLPLTKEKERITYAGLRKYLMDLKRDNSLIVKVFDRKGEYQSFISRYGLYESEWEIIRGINKTEGHVRTYFESRYKTTRKVVEDLLIEEIIQKSFFLKSGMESTQESMSKTLLDIKDNLLKLSKQKNEIKNYDYQIELLSNFSNRITDLKGMYEERTVTIEQLGNLYANIHQTLSLQEELKSNLSLKMNSAKELGLALSRQVDSIKYAFSKKEASELQKERETVSEELRVLNDERENLLKRLNFMESGNDYLEFLEESKKKEEISEAIAAVDSKNSGLIDEIHQLVGNLKCRFEEKRELIQKQLIEDLSVFEQLQRNHMLLDDNERLLEKEAYVCNAKLLEVKEQIKKQQRIIEELKQEAGILVIEDLDQLLKEVLEEQSVYNKKLDSDKETQKDWNEKRKNFEEQKREIEFDIKQLEKSQKEEEIFFEEYETVKNQIHQLNLAYGVLNEKELQNEIKNRYKANIKEAELIKNTCTKLKERTENLEKGFVLAEEGVLTNILSIIQEKYPGSGMGGYEYIESLAKEKRQEIVSLYPYLPFSIVVKEPYYETIAKEVYEYGDKFQDYIIPIINLSALKKEEYLFSIHHMVLAAKNIEMYFDSSKIQMEKKKIALQIEELQKELSVRKEKETIYLSDDQLIHTFLIKYKQEYMTKLERRDNCVGQLDQKTKLKEEVKQQIEFALKNVNECEVRKNQIEKQLQQSLKKQLYLERLCVQKDELEQKEDQVKEYTNQFEIQTKELLVTAQKKKQIFDSIEELQIHIKSRQEEQKEIQSMWDEKYSSYFSNQSVIIIDATTDEILAKVNGKILAYESEHTDMQDKKQLIQSYVASMNRLRKSILNRGISEETLACLYKEHKLYAISEDEIEKKRKDTVKLEEEIAYKRTLLDKLTAQWNRLDGKISNTKEEIKERYGFIEKIEIENQSMEALLYNCKQKKIQCHAELKKYEEEEKRITVEITELEEVRKDIERMFKSTGYLENSFECIGNNCISIIDLKAEFIQLERTFERLGVVIKEKQTEFYKYKQKLTEALLVVNATGLAQEISVSVAMPTSELEATNLKDNIIEVSQLLELEKVRIERGIADIQSIKSNFENQCLQQCINVKAELEKLSKYSKIMLDGESIPIISLIIPYVKEELFQERMSNYIEETVLGVDDYANINDKLKYIRSALSLKKMFSVIVTDMNQIKLSLYKRERMKINSRHLRYEDAVGSTGQSQGIYIQFLIAIINYISNLNSSNSNNSQLRKVIFIDNPFGAAKDVYIWEPIFELLKTNRVQLIVPARGTTPAITGRFDVNYILGQKVVDGKQQTVVVDYESKVDVQEIEYIPLEFEQTSLNLYD